MLRIFFLIFMVLQLNACDDSPPNETVNPSATRTKDHQEIASAVLNVAQGEDFLRSSKRAMQNISASDIADVAADLPPREIPPITPETEIHALPQACQQYFVRAQQCYQSQPHAKELTELLAQQQSELAAESPDDDSCRALSRSFDAVAAQLLCP